MRYLVVRQSDGLVVNAVIWDGVSPYSEEGCDLVPLPNVPGVWVGWQLVDGEWIAPPPPPEEPVE